MADAHGCHARAGANQYGARLKPVHQRHGAIENLGRLLVHDGRWIHVQPPAHIAGYPDNLGDSRLVARPSGLPSPLCYNPSSMRVPRLPQWIMLLTLAAVAASATQPAEEKRSKKEERTQVLQLPTELPAVTTGNPRRLKFYVTPLTGKGLLTHQIREALKALERQSGGETVLKIRAFVAGSGDVRRVRDLVSEEFTGRKRPLPALTLVRAGGLPMEGAQVVLETIVEGHKDVNPHGLAFFSAQAAASASPLDPAAPLVRKALAQLGQAIQAAG